MSETSITAIATADAAALRRSLRKNAIAQRVLQKKETIAAWSEQIIAHLEHCFPTPPGGIIGFCWPVHNEPDLRPLLLKWSVLHCVSALPVVLAAGQALRFRAWQPGEVMLPDAHGIPAPCAGKFVLPDVLLIPLNAFDAAGFRLGYGGGYFDRTLAELRPRPLAIGVGFELGRVASVMPQPHDIRLDWIVTEGGAWRP